MERVNATQNFCTQALLKLFRKRSAFAVGTLLSLLIASAPVPTALAQENEFEAFLRPFRSRSQVGNSRTASEGRRPWGGQIDRTCFTISQEFNPRLSPQQIVKNWDRSFFTAFEQIRKCQTQFPDLGPYFDEFYRAMVRTRFTCERTSANVSRQYANYRAPADRILFSSDITRGLTETSPEATRILIHELFHATSANNRDDHNTLQFTEVFPSACDQEEPGRLDDRVLWLTSLCTHDEEYLDLLLTRIEACGIRKGCHRVLTTETQSGVLDDIPILSIFGNRFRNVESEGLGEQRTQAVCNTLPDHLIRATECLRARRDPKILQQLLQSDRWQELGQRLRESRETLWQGDRFSSRWLTNLPLEVRRSLTETLESQPECAAEFITSTGDIDFTPLRTRFDLASASPSIDESAGLLEWNQGLIEAISRNRETLRTLRLTSRPELRAFNESCKLTLLALGDTLEAIELQVHHQFSIPSSPSTTDTPESLSRLDREYAAQAMDLASRWSSTFFRNDPNSRRLLGEDLFDQLRQEFDRSHPQGAEFDCAAVQRIRPTLPAVLDALNPPSLKHEGSAPCHPH